MTGESSAPDVVRAERWEVVVHASIASAAGGDLSSDVRTILDHLRNNGPIAAIAVNTPELALALTITAVEAQNAAITALNLVEELLPDLVGRIRVEGLAVTRPGGVEDPTSMDGELDLLGFEELGRLLELSPTGLGEFVASPRFPEPIANLEQGPVWRRTQILRFLGHDTQDDIRLVDASP